MAPPALQMQNPIGGPTSAEALISHAHKLLANCGIAISPSKVSRMVRKYKHRVENNGFPFEAFLVNTVQLSAQQRRQMLANPDIASVISYSDPTGETAVNNVVRGRCTTVPRRAPLASAAAGQSAVTFEELVADAREREDILAMTDGVSDEMFEEALAEARAEGGLSRENVARKCKARPIR